MVHRGVLTGNVPHILDAGPDQEAQSMGEKAKPKQHSVKKNHELGDGSLEETETPTL